MRKRNPFKKKKVLLFVSALSGHVALWQICHFYCTLSALKQKSATVFGWMSFFSLSLDDRQIEVINTNQ